jgi:hypothetical protein
MINSEKPPLLITPGHLGILHNCSSPFLKYLHIPQLQPAKTATISPGVTIDSGTLFPTSYIHPAIS